MVSGLGHWMDAVDGVNIQFCKGNQNASTDQWDGGKRWWWERYTPYTFLHANKEDPFCGKSDIYVSVPIGPWPKSDK
jgi:hypothetical protein